MIKIKNKKFFYSRYELEDELEEDIQLIKSDLFPKDSIYFNVKRLIGKKGGKRNIPDGYLVSLQDKKHPKIFTSEVEISTHDDIKHIAIQLFEFSLSYSQSPNLIKEIIRNEFKKSKSAIDKINKYLKDSHFDNLDHMLDHAIHKEEFSVLLIIDEINEDLETILNDRLRFPIHVVKVKRYISNNGEKVHSFNPLFYDLIQPIPANDGSDPWIQLDEIDTIVVPARKDGFDSVFKGENRWWDIKISNSIKPQLKYIACYQVKPISGITHYAEISSIESGFKDSKKYIVNFKGSATKLKKPISLVKNGSAKAPQSPRYTNFSKIKRANNLDDVFS